jgi:hypothetical protein
MTAIGLALDGACDSGELLPKGDVALSSRCTPDRALLYPLRDALGFVWLLLAVSRPDADGRPAGRRLSGRGCRGGVSRRGRRRVRRRKGT